MALDTGYKYSILLFMLYVFAYPSLELANPEAWDRFCRGDIPFPFRDLPAHAGEARILVIRTDDATGGSVLPVSVPLDQQRYVLHPEITFPTMDTRDNVIDLRSVFARRLLRRHFAWHPNPQLIERALSRCRPVTEDSTHNLTH